MLIDSGRLPQPRIACSGIFNLGLEAYELSSCSSACNANDPGTDARKKGGEA
jgi:hypothetical protein